MSEDGHRTTVGQLPSPPTRESPLPRALTRLVWLLWLASVVALVVGLRRGVDTQIAGLFVVDGLTVAMWAAVAFFSGIVHSYSRRYMAGNASVDRFFGSVFAFTLAVLVLVAADHLALFVTAWVAMGLAMADLIGHADGWPQAAAAGSLARRYFLAGGALLAGACVTLWWSTGATTISGVAAGVGQAPGTAVLVAAAALVLAAMVQSALLPFHTWLVSSMTAPTPASALMHAGFVNAGGLLLVRFAPVVTAEPAVMFAIALVGACSAIGGKLLKAVQPDVKGRLGCSTVGQMGFMVMQAGLGFFAAAIAHLLLHGCYKAYRFLGAGREVTHEHPAPSDPAGGPGVAGSAVVVATGLAGGVLFAALTGKGSAADGGLLLTLLVVLTVMLAARDVAAQRSLPAPVRHLGVPLLALPAIAVYAVVYRAIEGLLAGLPGVGEPLALGPVHWLLAAAFVAAYLAVETGLHRRSRRLYVALLNAGQPDTDTLLTTPEDYNEY